ESGVASQLVRSRNLVRLDFLDQIKVIEKALCSVPLPRRQRELDELFERNVDAYYRSVVNRHADAPQLADGAFFLEQAIDAGLRLANRETGRVEDWVAVAHLLAKANRLDEALVWISRAVAVSPDVADYYRLQESVLERLKRFE